MLFLGPLTATAKDCSRHPPKNRGAQFYSSRQLRGQSQMQQQLVLVRFLFLLILRLDLTAFTLDAGRQ